MDFQKSYKYMLKTIKGFASILPIMLGIIFLIGLVKEFITFKSIATLFGNNLITDVLFGSVAGSILAGNALNSYVIGGELLDSGVSLFAITAFLVSWVTVGIVQLPAESAILGKKFALWRNVISFILTLIVAVFVVIIMGVVS